MASKKTGFAAHESPYISVRGAREHNLRGVNIDLPRNQLVVITGLSGSGKSSLAFDTIYAEGQRRYVESLSAYARQLLELMDKPVKLTVGEYTNLKPTTPEDMIIAHTILRDRGVQRFTPLLLQTVGKYDAAFVAWSLELGAWSLELGAWSL